MKTREVVMVFSSTGVQVTGKIIRYAIASASMMGK